MTRDELMAQADEIVKAAEKFAAALPKSGIVVPTVRCSRCSGEGWDHFHGFDRPKGRCFKCLGTGQAPVTTSPEFKAAEAAYAAREVEGLRVMYRGLTLAMSFATAAAADGHWAAVAQLEGLAARRANVAAAGKTAVRAA